MGFETTGVGGYSATYYSITLDGVEVGRYATTAAQRSVHVWRGRAWEPIETYIGKIRREDSEDKIAASAEMKRYIESLEREAEAEK